MRIIVIAPGSPEFSIEVDRPMTRSGLSDASHVAELAAAARPAVEQYACRAHRRMRIAIERLRGAIGRDAVDWAFVSPAYGYVSEDSPIPPYTVSFDDMDRAELPDWADSTGLRHQIAKALDEHDVAVFLLHDMALRAILPLPDTSDCQRIFLLHRDDRRLVQEAPGTHVVLTSMEGAVAHGVKSSDLKGRLFDLLIEAIATHGESWLTALRDSPSTLREALTPRAPEAEPISGFLDMNEPAEKPRVRFFIPECDDRVDPGFDFLRDEPSLHRMSDLDDAFAHDPELYGKPNYDGILISKNQIEERPFKHKFVERVGVHAYLRVPADYPVMGDCGAFTYFTKEKPPYETEEILEYYQRFGFNYGVSIDHLVIPPAYTGATAHIVRLDGSRLDLTKEQLTKLQTARKAESRLAAMEEVVTYLPEKGLVVVERKLLKGAEVHPGTWPAALDQLVATGQHPPFTASRLAKMRQFSYYQAQVDWDETGTKAFFDRMGSLMADGAMESGHFEAITREAYDALMRSKADRDQVGEILRQDKWVYYPESEDATLERVRVDLREIRYRFLLTIRNGRHFFRRHARGNYRFEPIGAVQGWHGPLFRYAVAAFLRMGYRYLAIGGLAMARTEEILEVLRAIQPALAEQPDVDLHLFGVARNEQVPAFIRLGVTSFDSTGPLRKAWLNATANYLSLDGPAYAAIRIPDPHSSPKAKGAIDNEAGVTRQYLIGLERRALTILRAYDRGEAGLEETLDAIMAYDELLGDDRKFRELFRRTLEDQPWKKCPCAICRKVGIDVMIFRGNDRNRRRGFHNTWVFYQELQQIRSNLDNHNPDPGEMERAVPKPEKPFIQLAFEF